MNFKLTIDPPGGARITRTGAAVDLAANIFPTLKAARNALTDMVDSRIRALRRIRDEVIRTPERDLPSDEPAFQTIGQQQEFQAARAGDASPEGPQAEVAKDEPTGKSSGPTSLGADPAVSGAGDDLLAVPAFLRRQAPAKELHR